MRSQPALRYGLQALGRQDDVVLEVERCLWIALARLERDDEVVFDSEDGVALDVGVVVRVELRDEGAVVGMADLEVCQLAERT